MVVRELLLGMASNDVASTQHVRYLFDSQLFNVPNNYHHYEYLLAYLKHENIFDMSYVVRQQSHRLRKTEFAGCNGLGAGDASATERWTNWSSLSRGSQTTANVGTYSNKDDAERCRLLFSNACRGVVGSPAQRQARFAAQPHQLSHPVNRVDVRDLMTNLTLHGGAREWLDLKLTLCLPTYIIFIKLNTSNTRVPNPDYTLNVSLKDLRVFGGNQTIGENLSMAIAEMRHTFFDIPLPDFDRLTLLKDGGLVDANESSSSRPAVANSANAANSANSTNPSLANTYGGLAANAAVVGQECTRSFAGAATFAPVVGATANSLWQGSSCDDDSRKIVSTASSNELLDFEDELERFNANDVGDERDQKMLERRKRELHRLQFPGALRKVLVVSEFGE